MQRKLKKEEVEEIVKSSESFLEVNNKIGGDYRFIKSLYSFIKYNNIDYSHFKKVRKKRTKKKDGDLPTGNIYIKIYLIKNNILERKCYKCNLTHWNEELIPLDLHHKDKNRNNNSVENLTLLCPNCHNQEHRKDDFLVIDHKKNICKKCGEKCSNYCDHCLKCYKVLKSKKSKIPNKETLEEDLKTLKYKTKIGKKYGVTDNCVKKWLKKYNLL
jgi:hypothetical protein